MHRLSPTAVAALAAMCLSPARAQVDAPQRDLGTVTITAGQPTSLPTQIPTTIEGVTREQIADTLNATDSQDALKYLPSLLVRKRYIGDYNHAVLSTRASGTGNPARSMVYADGILLSNYLGNGPTNAPRWMMVGPEEIERVDVLYGPFSAAYPGNSVGAVVDYVTRMPRTFEAHGKVSVQHQPYRLYNTDGRYTGYQASASAGNRAGDWSWFFSLTGTRSEGQPQTFATRLVSAGTPGAAGTPVTGAVLGLNRANQPWYLLGTGTAYTTTQQVAKFKLAYDITPTLRAAYTLGVWDNQSNGQAASYLRNAAGQPVTSGVVNIDGRSFTLQNSDFALTRERLTHLMHGVSVKSNTQGVWDWEIAASLYDYDTDELRRSGTALPGAQTGGAGSITDSDGTGWTTVGLKGTWRPDGPRGAHVIDMGLQHDEYRLRTRTNATPQWISGAPGALTEAFAGDSTLTSLWAQDTWRLAPRWKAVLGGRWERWVTDSGFRTNGVGSVQYAARAETYFSPKAALSWQAAPSWVLKASTGRAVRMPTVSELYQGGVNNLGQTTLNDPNLKPEQSWTTELTAERDLGNGLWRLTAFFERTKDALYSQTNTTVTPNITNIQNVDRVRTEGLEVAYQATDVFTRGIDLLGSVTWADSRVTRNDRFPASVGKRQIRVPDWRATAAITWRPDDRWSTTLGARYSGRQFSTLDNSDPNGDAYMGASAYFTTDLRVTWRATPRTTLAFGIDNLNNDRYWNFHPYPQRTFHLELRSSL
jgi:iron complex outermembrane receptor protein